MENQSGAAKRYVRAVCEHDSAHGLTVYKGPVRGAEVDEDDLAVLHAQLGVVPRHTGVNHAQVAVRAAAEQGNGRLKLISAARLHARARLRPSHHKPWPAREDAAAAPREVADRLPTPPRLNRVPADHPGPDAEHAGRKIGNPFEPY